MNEKRSRPSLVVIEDEIAYQLLAKKALHLDYDLKFFSSFKQAVEWIPSLEVPECIIMDVMLDEADGFELCALMKTYSHLRDVPFIFLTSNDQTSSKVLGLSLGANDYLVKPCDPIELRARVQVRISERKFNQRMVFESSKDQTFGLIQFDIEGQRVIVNGSQPSEKPVELRLTPLEFKMFLYMAKNEGHTVSRAELLEEVWGKNHHVIARTVDTFIAGLRKKLGRHKHLVKSVHGVGYKFNQLGEKSKAA